MTRALRARAGETGGDPVEDPVVGTWFATGWTYALLAVPVLLLPAALAHGGDPALRMATSLLTGALPPAGTVCPQDRARPALRVTRSRHDSPHAPAPRAAGGRAGARAHRPSRGCGRGGVALGRLLHRLRGAARAPGLPRARHKGRHAGAQPGRPAPVVGGSRRDPGRNGGARDRPGAGTADRGATGRCDNGGPRAAPGRRAGRPRPPPGRVGCRGRRGGRPGPGAGRRLAPPLRRFYWPPPWRGRRWPGPPRPPPPSARLRR
jgi:hypothetical protein